MSLQFSTPQSVHFLIGGVFIKDELSVLYSSLPSLAQKNLRSHTASHAKIASAARIRQSRSLQNWKTTNLMRNATTKPRNSNVLP
jgi:hypothetical protein